MTFLIAVLRFLICNLDRCLAVPENQPPAMLQLAKLQRAGFVFAPKRLPEPVHSVPSQPPSLPATKLRKFQATPPRIFLKVTTL